MLLPIKSYCLKRITLCKEPQTHTNALLVLHAKDLYKVLKEKRITTYQQVEIDNTHPLLVYAMGKCERIKTPFFQQLIAFIFALRCACLSYSCRLDHY
jgi:hypothetical protein